MFNNSLTGRGVDEIGELNLETIEDLKTELHRIFERDEVDIDYVKLVMTKYRSNMLDWSRFAKWDQYHYTRNLVDSGNGKFNLMILCWNEAQGSSIHDHANSDCFMKCIDGELMEERFDWPDHDGEPMKRTQINALKLNSVAYINDKIGLHRVENPSHAERAASLHLYCPPYNECATFDERTGNKGKSVVTFYTKFGKKTTPSIISLTGTHEEN